MIRYINSLLLGVVLAMSCISLDAATATAVATQLLTEKKLCVQGIKPVTFKSSYMQPVAQALNNICIEQIKATPQGKNVVIQGIVTEQGTPIPGATIKILAQLQ